MLKKSPRSSRPSVCPVNASERFVCVGTLVGASAPRLLPAFETSDSKHSRRVGQLCEHQPVHWTARSPYSAAPRS